MEIKLAERLTDETGWVQLRKGETCFRFYHGSKWHESFLYHTLPSEDMEVEHKGADIVFVNGI